MKTLLGNNAVKVELPSHLKIHYVIHAFHTIPYNEQPSYISDSVTKRLDSIPTIGG